MTVQRASADTPRMRKIVFVLFLAVGCAHAGAQRQLADAKRQIMAADYRADLAGLEKLRDSLAPLTKDPQTGYLAEYWRGYADWRIALNGASRKMPAGELRKHLEAAVASFDDAVSMRPDFADAYAAGGSVNSWLAAFHRDDMDAMRPMIVKSASMIRKAMELEPENPRVLWVKGGDYFFRPAQYGGDKARAIETYKHALTAAEKEQVADPARPDWGKAESLMALAFANLNNEPPDTATARTYADAALREAPDWWYVREVLSHQIADAMAK